jgi:LmbE family N-acetylglucosaminyl deacetylase
MAATAPGDVARSVAMNILAVSAHADDETLGCGGTLLRHRHNGDNVAWLVLSEPSEGRRWSKATIMQKSAELERVGEAYGACEIIRSRLPAGRLDAVPIGDLHSQIADAVRRTQPKVVYLVYHGDAHTDHEVAFRAAASVLKPFHLRELGVRRVLSYETLSSTEAGTGRPFAPNVYVDISPWLEQKLAIMAMYESERHAEPMPRAASAIRALARFRGATVGVEYAEAFVLIHAIDWE